MKTARLTLNKDEEELILDGLIGEAIKSLRDRAQFLTPFLNWHKS